MKKKLTKEMILRIIELEIKWCNSHRRMTQACDDCFIAGLKQAKRLVKRVSIK